MSKIYGWKNTGNMKGWQKANMMSLRSSRIQNLIDFLRKFQVPRQKNIIQQVYFNMKLIQRVAY